MSKEKFYRKGKREDYTVPHEAQCLVCHEIRRFFRHPNDKNRGKIGHMKNMFCYFCRRITKHIQLGEVVQ